jgi:hypothetical protein
VRDFPFGISKSPAASGKFHDITSPAADLRFLAWEKTHGLDPNDARDGSCVRGQWITNVENYLNELRWRPDSVI